MFRIKPLILKTAFLLIIFTCNALAQSTQPEAGFYPLESGYVINAGESAMFEAFSFSGTSDLRYIWDLGDGRNEEGQQISVVYNEPGAYHISLTAYGANGQEIPSPFSRWLFVNDPALVADPNQVQPIQFLQEPVNGAVYALGEAVGFKGHGFDANDETVTLYWDLDDGTITSGRTDFRHTYASPGTWYPKLFVRDAGGYTQYNLVFSAIQIFEGQRPPDGLILSPAADKIVNGNLVHEIAAGERLALKGSIVNESDERAPYHTFWRLYGESHSLQFEGLEPEPMVLPPDYYYVFFHVIDKDGLEDPIAPEVQLWVRDGNRPPQTQITEPSYDPTLKTGQGLNLSAWAADPDNDPVRFTWEISDGRRFEGVQIDNVTFPEAGLFRISLTATDDRGATGRAEQDRYVIVIDDNRNCTNDPVSIRPVSPTNSLLTGPVGVSFPFTAETTAESGPARSWHWDFSHGKSAEGRRPGAIRFDEPGWYPIRVFASDGCGRWTGSELWSVFIYGGNIPPQGTIIAPSANTRDENNRPVHAVPLGNQVTLEGQAVDVDGNLPLHTTWQVDFDFHDIGLNPMPFNVAEARDYLVQFFVQDSVGQDDPFADAATVKGVDLSQPPSTRIHFPDGPITIEPGEAVYFQASGSDPNGLVLDYEWDFGPAADRAGFEGALTPAIRFNMPSPDGEPYQVRVYAKTLLTRDPVGATVAITVKTVDDAELEPNNSLSTAPVLQQGGYSHLSLNDTDPRDFFRFQINEDGRNLRLFVGALDGNVNFRLYRLDENGWRPFETGVGEINRDTITLENAPAGEYAAEISIIDSSIRKDGLSYGMSFYTLQPMLFLPFLVEDGNLSSSLGLINPTSQTAAVSLIGLDAAGNRIASVDKQLGSNARIFLSSKELFGQTNNSRPSREVRWVQVLSTARLIGYMTGESIDETQLMAVGAIQGLASGIMVPHIADPDNGWYTRASVVNALPEAQQIDFEGPDTNFPAADPALGNSQTDFRFNGVLSGPLPEWGSFRNTTGQAGLAGVEIFGRTDSLKEIAGIEMIDIRRNNPNFTYIANNLYFSHIAIDTVNWWTGISLINLSRAETTYTIIGYDANGNEQARLANQKLPPGGKLLKTAAQLFGDADVRWAKVEGDASLAGFELFGSPEQNRMAGFQASPALSDTLYFPHMTRVGADEEYTAVSLVNTSDTAVNISIEVFSDSGSLLTTTRRPLAARSKLVSLVNTLLDPEPLPVEAGYLKITADRAVLTGFELFGTLDIQAGGLGEKLAGLAAIPY